MTSIAWTDATWNPTSGCDRTSPGCDHCYALTMAGRLKLMGQPGYQHDGDPRTSGPGFALTLHPDRLDVPLRWRKPRMVFVNSMSDLFHPDVSDSFIEDVFARMALTRRHIYQVLTKRAKRMAQILGYRSFDRDVAETATEIIGGTGPYERQRIETDGWRPSGSVQDRRWWPPLWPLPNVWLGVSIENDRYTFRADHLRATPAAVRWVSAEPLLGPLPSLDLTGIDWLVVGGESGPGARPMDVAWARDLRDRCRDAGVAFFMKQTGTVLARELGCSGKGENPDEWPADLQIRDYPRLPPPWPPLDREETP